MGQGGVESTGEPPRNHRRHSSGRPRSHPPRRPAAYRGVAAGLAAVIATVIVVSVVGAIVVISVPVLAVAVIVVASIVGIAVVSVVVELPIVRVRVIGLPLRLTRVGKWHDANGRHRGRSRPHGGHQCWRKSADILLHVENRWRMHGGISAGGDGGLKLLRRQGQHHQAEGETGNESFHGFFVVICPNFRRT